MLEADLVGVEDAVGVGLGHVGPDHALAFLVLLQAALDEALAHLGGGVELQVVEEQRVLAGEEGLAVADGGE